MYPQWLTARVLGITNGPEMEWHDTKNGSLVGGDQGTSVTLMLGATASGVRQSRLGGYGRPVRRAFIGGGRYTTRL